MYCIVDATEMRFVNNRRGGEWRCPNCNGREGSEEPPVIDAEVFPEPIFAPVGIQEVNPS